MKAKTLVLTTMLALASMLVVAGSANANAGEVGPDTDPQFRAFAVNDGQHECKKNPAQGGQYNCWSVDGGCYTEWNDDDYDSDYEDENATVTYQICAFLRGTW